MLRSVCLAFLVSMTAAAADPTKVDPQPVPVKIEAVAPVTAEVGRKCTVTVKTTAKKVTWRIPADVDYVLLTPDGKSLGVWALPGTYPLTAFAPSGDDVVVADVTVTITGGVPLPHTPTLTKDVKSAYAAESAANKADLAKKLAALYRAAGTVTVKDASVKTYYDLYQDVSTANAAQMGQTDLQGVRLTISKYLDAKMPTDKKTAIDRTLAATEFLNIATALEALK